MAGDSLSVNQLASMRNGSGLGNLCLDDDESGHCN